jgi:chaperonin cofactor prefoldin
MRSREKRMEKRIEEMRKAENWMEERIEEMRRDTDLRLQNLRGPCLGVEAGEP